MNAMLLVLAGCGQPSDDGAPTSPTSGPAETGTPEPTITGHTGTSTTGDTGSITAGPTGDTGGPTDTGAVTATGGCVASSHPLIFECSFQLASPAALTLSVRSPSATNRTFTSAASTQHDLLAWGLQPDTTYTWSAAGLSGSLQTGSLPAGLSGLAVQTNGNATLFGADAVMVFVGCGYFVMIEDDGDVVWYTPTSVFDGLSDGMMWSQNDHTVLASKDSTMGGGGGGGGTSVFEERDLLGSLTLRLDTTDFDLKLTHDVGRWQGYTYLLGETAGGVGGFEVFDGTTKLGQWLLTDAFNNVGNSHVNGLVVDDNGQVVISEHTSDTIIAVDGDPSSPTFLQKQWHAASGTGSSYANADYQPPSGVVLFDGQHNASRHGDELWVFDNRSQGTARALRMAMDHTNGRITELDSWSMGGSCTNQGGSTPIPGGVLATCANSGWVTAFRDGASTADWAMRAQCNGAGSTRGFPVTVE